MADLRKILGERIRIARMKLSLSQQQLASLAGFSAPQIISQIEKGVRDIKAWELFSLAKALRMEVSQLLSAEGPAVHPPILWRKYPEQDRGLLEAEFLRRCEQYALLEKLHDLEPAPELPESNMNFATMPFHDALRAAGRFGEAVWKELDLGSRPAGSLVNMLEDKYRVKIWYENLGDGGSAASTKSSFGSAILMNVAEPPWRRNFSFGHEFFHLVTWNSIPPQSLMDNPRLWKKIEKLAEAFASSLLLPCYDTEGAFYSRVKDKKVALTDLIEIAREFGVSTGALLWRLVNLGFVSRQVVESLLDSQNFRALDRSFRQSGWTTLPEIPERFVRLAFTAYLKGRLSRPRLAEYLNTSLVDLTDTLLEYGLDDHQDYETSVRASRR